MKALLVLVVIIVLTQVESTTKVNGPYHTPLLPSRHDGLFMQMREKLHAAVRIVNLFEFPENEFGEYVQAALYLFASKKVVPDTSHIVHIKRSESDKIAQGSWIPHLKTWLGAFCPSNNLRCVTAEGEAEPPKKVTKPSMNVATAQVAGYFSKTPKKAEELASYKTIATRVGASDEDHVRDFNTIHTYLQGKIASTPLKRFFLLNRQSDNGPERNMSPEIAAAVFRAMHAKGYQTVIIIGDSARAEELQAEAEKLHLTVVLLTRIWKTSDSEIAGIMDAYRLGGQFAATAIAHAKLGVDMVIGMHSGIIQAMASLSVPVFSLGLAGMGRMEDMKQICPFFVVVQQPSPTSGTSKTTRARPQKGKAPPPLAAAAEKQIGDELAKHEVDETLTRLSSEATTWFDTLTGTTSSGTSESHSTPEGTKPSTSESSKKVPPKKGKKKAPYNVETALATHHRRSVETTSDGTCLYGSLLDALLYAVHKTTVDRAKLTPLGKTYEELTPLNAKSKAELMLRILVVKMKTKQGCEVGIDQFMGDHPNNEGWLKAHENDEDLKRLKHFREQYAQRQGRAADQKQLLTTLCDSITRHEGKMNSDMWNALVDKRYGLPQREENRENRIYWGDEAMVKLAEKVFGVTIRTWYYDAEPAFLHAVTANWEPNTLEIEFLLNHVKSVHLTGE